MARRGARDVFRRIEAGLLGDQAPRRVVPPAVPAPPGARRRTLPRLFGQDPDASPLERALGPGCLLSLVIVALLLVAFRRLTSLPPTALALVAVVVFVAVMFLLLRLRPVRIDGNEKPGGRRGPGRR